MNLKTETELVHYIAKELVSMKNEIFIHFKFSQQINQEKIQ